MLESKYKDLRDKAVQLLEHTGSDKSHDKLDVLELIQELQINQAELEIQNEELRHAQQSLIQSKNNYFDMYIFAPVGYATLDKKGIICSANLALTELLATQRKKLIGYPLSRYIHNNYLMTFFEYLKKTMKESKSTSCDLQLTAKQDSAQFIRVTSSHAVDDQSGEKLVRMAMIDITDIYQSKKSLDQTNAQLTEQLQSKTNELTSCLQQLSSAQQQERTRLAKLLHNDLQQLISAAKMHVGVLSSNDNIQVKQVAQNVISLLDESLETSRSLVTDLVPPVLSKSGLTDSLKWLCDWVQEKHHLSVSFVSSALTDITDDEVKLLAFESVRELLFNVVKHAGVSNASIEMSRTDQKVKIVVTDKGVGFDPQTLRSGGKQMHSGLGLTNMQNLLKSIGGNLEIQSEPGKGSKFTVTVPLQQ